MCVGLERFFSPSYEIPYRVRSSHIARFCSTVNSTVVEGATPADNAGGTAGSGCGGGMGKGSLGGGGKGGTMGSKGSLGGGGTAGGAIRVEIDGFNGRTWRDVLGDVGIIVLEMVVIVRGDPVSSARLEAVLSFLV